MAVHKSMLTGLTALTVLVLFGQVHFESLHWLSELPIHALEIAGLAVVIEWVVYLVNYVLFPFLVLGFLARTFLMKPKVVKNLTNATFLAVSMAVAHLLQLLIGELPPRLLMFINKHPTVIKFCASSYGTPNTSVFLAVCFFFLFRGHFFKKRERLENYAQIDTQNSRFFFQTADQDIYLAAQQLHGFQVFGRVLDFRSYCILAWVSIILLAVANWLALLSSAPQLLATVFLALHWGYFFHSVVRINLKKYFFNLIREPAAVLNLTRQLNRVLLFLLGLAGFVLGVRELFYNAADMTLIKAEMKASCPDDYYLQRSAFLGCLWVFFVFTLNMYLAISPTREKIFTSTPSRLTFADLQTSDRVRRGVVVFAPPLVLVFLHLMFKSLLKGLPEYTYLLECAWVVLLICLLGIYLSGWAPYLLFRYSILLQSEYLFRDSLRKEHRTKFEQEMAESKTKQLYQGSANAREDVDQSQEALRDRQRQEQKGATLAEGIGNSSLVIKVKGLSEHK